MGRYFALDGTDHSTHQEQASMIRRYIIWRNNYAYDERLRRITDRATLPNAALVIWDVFLRAHRPAGIPAIS